ncbi:glycoside hydrolase family 24 protein [Campylobacter rectus]|uniref:Phage lysozyme, putative n=4 Tax=Campylobacter rectus TaxID=203 RepID=A0A6G5QQC2_CAMRE|nr:glycoside hydrolase family 104 protein [Campylobacter rectus]QCD47752.1 phage lysozyme, putative [Campylobacter rectus]UEB48448.1 glycoside hydrolase family 104 protein [Campylobacter rectus]
MGKNFKITKNKDSLFKNSYTATFNIPIDKENKKDTKLIIYSSDLSKTHTTKDIHKRSDTAVISLSYKDKNNQSFCYLRKTSLRDITDNIINVISDNEYPFKTNEDITLKAIYKQEEKDERGNENKKYKEVVWGYKVIKTVEYNEASKSNPKDVILLKNKKDERIKETKDNKSNKEEGLIKGKEITIQISKVVTKDDLAKLKQGGHSIIFFAALKEKEKKEKETDKKKKQNDKFKDTNEAKFQFNTGYGKTHMRVDIKIPLYIKFKDDRVIVYEFEHAIKQKVFKAGINYNDALINKSGYLYINKDIASKDINIYKDDKLSKELKTDEKTNKNYRIYIDEANSANNQNPSNTNPVQSQTGQTNINQDTKYGINLLSKDNMDKFISSFNESKSLTRVDKGMWVDGDVAIKVEINRDIRILRIRAFMCAIKYGEGTNGNNGYEINVGGKLFTKDYGKDFSDHPRYYVKSLDSSAAGAYQIKSSTWDMILKKYKRTYGITDFSPINQDKACLILIKHIRNALDLIADEKIDEAVRSRTDNKFKRLHYEWASMPDSPYGQRTITMEKFMEYYMYHLELEKRDISDLAIDDEEIKRFLD